LRFIAATKSSDRGVPRRSVRLVAGDDSCGGEIRDRMGSRGLAAKAKSSVAQWDYNELAREWDMIADQIETLRRDRARFG
jgi:hypothetical protein